MTDNKQLPSLIKWTGGKGRELDYIFENLPKSFGNYFEPFVGGGAVFCALNKIHKDGRKYYINDAHEELMDFYNYLSIGEYAMSEAFFQYLEWVNACWESTYNLAKEYANLNLYRVYEYSLDFTTSEEGVRAGVIGMVDGMMESGMIPNFPHLEMAKPIFIDTIIDKIVKMKKMEIRDKKAAIECLETAIMASLYTLFRNLYNNKELKKNNALHTALFIFIRNYSYTGMFRYNKNGDFNAPYGGLSYNKKTLRKKIDYYRSDELQKHFNEAYIFNGDFSDFLTSNHIYSEDFLFLDPPYDTEFNNYDGKEFGEEEQKKLADYLLNWCSGKWMMIIKKTPLIENLYFNKGLNIKKFDKKYLVNFKNRNNQEAEHLIIMNYNNDD